MSHRVGDYVRALIDDVTGRVVGWRTPADEDQLNETVLLSDVSSFDPSGTADSTPAILEAARRLRAGGVVELPPNAKVLIDTALTVPFGVTLRQALQGFRPRLAMKGISRPSALACSSRTSRA